MAVLLPTDPSPSTVSLSLTALTSLSIREIEDAEQLPVELFQSLQSLEIGDCPRLKALPLGAVLRSISTLETLIISDCPELDLSTENDGDDDDGGNAEGMTDLLQLQGHHKLRHLTIKGIHKAECLPGWFQYLSNLQSLTIGNCEGLKSLLPVRLSLPLLTTLDSLVLYICPELDLSIGESEDMPMAAYSQFTKLRNLVFYDIKKMAAYSHLTNLEDLRIQCCNNLKALPEWFPNLTSLKYLVIVNCGEELTRRCQGKNGGGEDWPKISHIPQLVVVRADLNGHLKSL
ncbi:disease resistance protein RGA2-like [Punica granatum]|uniref:Disease resistance protein RGA2-like n=1 Tax=Punica granatum TaxID=22663 RepID=A0A6P8BY82_PUNGR|nr:disease resistance protein RGA2-like [Punica granatum]